MPESTSDPDCYYCDTHEPNEPCSQHGAPNHRADRGRPDMSDVDLDALAEVARAAYCDRPDQCAAEGLCRSGDSAFVTTFNPPTVLALIERVRVAEAELAAEVRRADKAVVRANHYEGQFRLREHAPLTTPTPESGTGGACTCGHGPELHDAEADPVLCLVCGDNTRCNYADAEAIAADRWDEGWNAAVVALCPLPAGDPGRLLWVIDRPPSDNPYRPTPESGTDEGGARSVPPLPKEINMPTSAESPNRPDECTPACDGPDWSKFCKECVNAGSDEADKE
jgi:hypothetical protein